MQGQKRSGVARWIERAAMVAATLTLAACSSIKNKGEDVRLLQLGGLLQGHYDNVAQVEADIGAGRAPHDAVNVVIVQLNSLTVGDHAYYLEMSDRRSGRVIEQRVFSLDSADGGILEKVWSLVEPERWRGAAGQPDLLAALQYKDLKQLVGCSLLWKKENDDGKFTATNDMTHCHATPPEARGAVYAKWEMELTPDMLSISEQAYDPDHKLLAGREDERFLRLQRTGN